MINNFDFLDKFITSKNLYEVILWDKFVDNYLYDSEDLKVIQLMQLKKLRWVEQLKQNLIPSSEKIENFPSRVNWIYNEVVSNPNPVQNSESSA